MDTLVRAGCDCLSQRIVGRGRSQSEDGATPACRRSKLDPLGDRTAAVGVQLQRHLVAHQSAIAAEPELLGNRDLLDEHSHPERPRH